MAGKYRSAESYRGNTEEAQENQLANLKNHPLHVTEEEKRRWEREEIVREKEEKEEKKEQKKRDAYLKRKLKGLKKAKQAPPPFGNKAYETDIIKFLEEQFYIPETRMPIVLSEFQKEKILKPLFYGEDRPTMALVGQTKKSGKSTLAAGIAAWFLLGKNVSGKGQQAEEIILAARDKQATQWIVFNKLWESIRLNPRLLHRITPLKDTLTRDSNGSVVRCVPMDISIAGMNPSLTIFDELWNFEYERMEAFFEELTTVPTRKNPLMFIISYAGDDKTSLLYRLYEKGLKGGDPTFYFIWDHENRMEWQTEAYLTQQKGRLRKNTFLRLHENRWAKAEEDFITPELYQGCVDERLVRRPKGRKLIYVGLDIGLRNDFSAVVAVHWDGADLLLTDHAVFEPEGDEALGLEDTVEKTILEWNEIYDIIKVNFDPMQCERSAQELRKHGIKCEAYKQTLDNLTMMSQILYSLITKRELALYPNDKVKEHLLNCIAESTGRGWRINKKKQRKKIDLTVALAMACMGACADIEEDEGEFEVFAGDGFKSAYGG